MSKINLSKKLETALAKTEKELFLCVLDLIEHRHGCDYQYIYQDVSDCSCGIWDLKVNIKKYLDWKSNTGPACSLMYDMNTGRMVEVTMEEL